VLLNRRFNAAFMHRIPALISAGTAARSGRPRFVILPRRPFHPVAAALRPHIAPFAALKPGFLFLTINLFHLHYERNLALRQSDDRHLRANTK